MTVEEEIEALKRISSFHKATPIEWYVCFYGPKITPKSGQNFTLSRRAGAQQFVQMNRPDCTVYEVISVESAEEIVFMNNAYQGIGKGVALGADVTEQFL